MNYQVTVHPCLHMQAQRVSVQVEDSKQKWFQNRGAMTVERPDTVTIDAPVDLADGAVGLSGMWQVDLFNDDHTYAGHVVACLMRVFGHNEQVPGLWQRSVGWAMAYLSSGALKPGAFVWGGGGTATISISLAGSPLAGATGSGRTTSLFSAGGAGAFLGAP